MNSSQDIKDVSDANAVNPAALTLQFAWNDFAKDSSAIEELEKTLLLPYLRLCRWFAGKARKITAVSVDSILEIKKDVSVFHLLIIKTKYKTGRQEHYLLPVSLVTREDALQLNPKAVITTCISNGQEYVIIDAIYDEFFRKLLFEHIYHGAKVKQPNGTLFFNRGKAFADADFHPGVTSEVLNVEQSNSSIIYGDRFFLKIYRKLFRETNPDVEVVSFLTEKAGFTHIPAYAGSLEWKKAYSAPITFGMMQEKVQSIKDAWSLTGDYLNEYLVSVLNGSNAIGEFVLDQVALLGRRTAEMHIALGSDDKDPAFAPEAFNTEYREWLWSHFESLLKRRIELAKENFNVLDEKGTILCQQFIEQAGTIRNFFHQVSDHPVQSLRTRIHGDYHLGQVLFNGEDYIILDFEGEPESPISERKIRHSPLKDVAGMLRSFHYAVSAKLYFSTETKDLGEDVIESAAQHWYRTVSEIYLLHYFQTMEKSRLIAADKSERVFLLQLHLLEKAIYELGYEFNGRPAWVKIPLKGIAQVLNEIGASL